MFAFRLVSLSVQAFWLHTGTRFRSRVGIPIDSLNNVTPVFFPAVLTRKMDVELNNLTETERDAITAVLRRDESLRRREVERIK